jgi:hypothetical protein
MNKGMDRTNPTNEKTMSNALLTMMRELLYRLRMLAPPVTIILPGHLTS